MGVSLGSCTLTTVPTRIGADICSPDGVVRERYYRRATGLAPKLFGALWRMEGRVRADEIAESEHAYDDDEQRLEAGRQLVAAMRDAARAGAVVGTADEDDLGETRGRRNLAAHAAARSVVLAEVARTDPQVIAYRARAIPDGPVTSTDELRRWVEQRWRPTDQVQPSLSWVDLEGNPLGVVSVDGSAPELRGLPGVSARLAKRYRWNKATAATWLLADGVAPSTMLRVNSATGMRPWNAQVTLTVHPDVPAAEVAAAYRDAQRRLLGPGRPRLLDETTSASVIAAFTTPGTWHRKHAAAAVLDPPTGCADGASLRVVVSRAAAKLIGDTGPSPMDRMRSMLTGS